MNVQFHSGDQFALMLKDMGIKGQNEAAEKFGVKQGTINSWLSKERFSPLILSRHFEKKLPKWGYNPKFLELPGQPMKLEDVGNVEKNIRQKCMDEIAELHGKLEKLSLLVAQL